MDKVGTDNTSRFLDSYEGSRRKKLLTSRARKQGLIRKDATPIFGHFVGGDRILSETP